MGSTTSDHWLMDELAARGDTAALVVPTGIIAYSQFCGLVKTWQQELAKQKIESGEVVAFEGDYSPATCSLVVALLASGQIAVPLTPTVRENKPRFLDIAQAAPPDRRVAVNDGWIYFMHGWLQVIAEVFDVEIPTSGPTFDHLSDLAGGAPRR